MPQSTQIALEYVSQDAKLRIGDVVVTGEGRSFHAGLADRSRREDLLSAGSALSDGDRRSRQPASVSLDRVLVLHAERNALNVSLELAARERPQRCRPLPRSRHRRGRVAFIALAIALLLQTTFLHALRFRGGTLSARVARGAVVRGIRTGAAAATFFGLIAGALEDALAGRPAPLGRSPRRLRPCSAARIVRGRNWRPVRSFSALVGAVAQRSCSRCRSGCVQRAEHPVLAPWHDATLHAAAVVGIARRARRRWPLLLVSGGSASTACRRAATQTATADRPPTFGSFVAFVAVLLLALAALVERLTQLQLVDGASLRRRRARQSNPPHSGRRAARTHLRPQRRRARAQPPVVRVRARFPRRCATPPAHAARACAHASRHRRGRAVAAAAPPPRHHTIQLRRGRDLASRTVRSSWRPIFRPHRSHASRRRKATFPASMSRCSPCATIRTGKSARTSSATWGRSPKTSIERARARGYSPNDVVGKDGLEACLRRRTCAARRAAQRDRSRRAGPLVRRLGPVDAGPRRQPRAHPRLAAAADRRTRRCATELAARAKRRRPARRGRRRRDRSAGPAASSRSPPIPTSIRTTSRGHQSTHLRALSQRSAAAALRSRDRRRDADRLDVQDGHRAARRSRAASSSRIKSSTIAAPGTATGTFRRHRRRRLGTTGFVHALAASSDGYFYQLGVPARATQRLR